MSLSTIFEPHSEPILEDCENLDLAEPKLFRAARQDHMQIIDDGCSVLRNRCDPADPMSSIARQRNRLMPSSFKACSDASFQTEVVNPDANPTVIGQDGPSVALPSVQAITLRVAFYRAGGFVR